MQLLPQRVRGMARRSDQVGVSLIVVTAIVMLLALMALWAMRTALFSELVTSNEADYQRAYQAAQAMVQDAKEDIVLNLQGRAARSGGAVLQLPEGANDFETWVFGLQALPTPCQQGLCVRRMGAENFWEDDSQLAAMAAVGARYKEFSGLEPGAHINPILKATAGNRGAWYWIEPLLFEHSQIGPTHKIVAGASSQPVQTDMLYRITAIALGMRGASAHSTDMTARSPTMAVIQTIVAFPATTGE